MPEDTVGGRADLPDSTSPPSRPNRTVTPAIAAALVVLAASFALSVAFVLANGGLDLPAAQRPSSSSAAIGVVASPSAAPTSTAQASIAPSSSSAPA